MREIITLLIVFLFTFTSANALEIVYPKSNPVNINASSTFFIGSTTPGEVLKINGKDVKVSEIGAFAQMVTLNFGKNDFVITSGKDTINFVIERTKLEGSVKKTQLLIDYPMMNNFYVKNNNVPLRSTPVDSGINRMSNLPKDMQLPINGEKAGFYKVYLGASKIGWIAKSDVEQRGADTCGKLSVKILNSAVKEENGFLIYEYDLQRPVPFTLNEENGVTLQLFNIEDSTDNVYTLNLPIPKLMGYDAYYEGNKFIFKVRKPLNVNMFKPLENVSIVLDAGHGGNEYGAIGCCGDKEKDINLAITKELQRELTARGAKIIMTRDDDVAVSLTDRVKIAKDNNAALSISVHANAIPDGADPNKNRGTSVYYYHKQAKALADNILNSMTRELGTQNDKVRQASLALVRPIQSVSVLVEVAYIINPDDYELLLDKSFQANCAKAIADGIENYLKN